MFPILLECSCHLRRFLKIAKRETVSFIVSVRLCARMEQLGTHGKYFHEIWRLNIFQKSVQKIQVTLKYYKNNGYFTWRPMYINDSFSLNSSDKFVGKIITFISFSISFFDVEYIYGFFMLGGFVRQVDDVTAQPFQRTVTPARATP